MEIETFYDLSPATRKLCSDAVYKDEKSRELLVAYYNLLNDIEKECFDSFSERFLGFKKCGAKKYKISKNAILIAMRLKQELGVACYPFVEKIATKGWSTADGTFSWSMRILSGSDIEQEVFSFEPSSMFKNRNYKLSIGLYNGFTTVSVE